MCFFLLEGKETYLRLPSNEYPFPLLELFCSLEIRKGKQIVKKFRGRKTKTALYNPADGS